MFEFSRHEEGEVLYQIVEKICPAGAEKEVEAPKKEETPAPAPTPPHRKINYSKRCSGIFHSCGECGHHETLGSDAGYVCDGDEFCFTYEHEPACGNCKAVFG